MPPVPSTRDCEYRHCCSSFQALDSANRSARGAELGALLERRVRNHQREADLRLRELTPGLEEGRHHLDGFLEAAKYALRCRVAILPGEEEFDEVPKLCIFVRLSN